MAETRAESVLVTMVALTWIVLLFNGLALLLILGS
jgi:hypothetical protein